METLGREQRLPPAGARILAAVDGAVVVVRRAVRVAVLGVSVPVQRLPLGEALGAAGGETFVAQVVDVSMLAASLCELGLPPPARGGWTTDLSLDRLGKLVAGQSEHDRFCLA